MKNKNAIILAAGKSNRFAPFNYEKPKGLFRVKGEILIERQIKQLLDAGIKDIYIVIGYMKEKFFYLEDKFGVHLIVNNTFDHYGNIYSLYAAREHLSNTFICCSDQYFVHNPFFDGNLPNNSYRACTYCRGKFKEFSIEYSDANVITNFAVGGEDQMAMTGHAYFNSDFSRRFRRLMEEEIHNFGVAHMYWEEFYAAHQCNLTLFVREFAPGEILEFDDIKDLRAFDSEFLMNIDSKIIKNICTVLDCHPNNIVNISVISAGLTNVSFIFELNGRQYVYRHPGGTAFNLVDRPTEIFAQNAAKELGLDDTLIHIDPAGWKISHYIRQTEKCDFKQNRRQLELGMDCLRKIHGVETNDTVKNFDTLEEALKLMDIAAGMKGNLREEFSDMIEKARELDELLKADAEELGLKRVFCHNDVYEPNYLIIDKCNEKTDRGEKNFSRSSIGSTPASTIPQTIWVVFLHAPNSAKRRLINISACISIGSFRIANGDISSRIFRCADFTGFVGDSTKAA